MDITRLHPKFQSERWATEGVGACLSRSHHTKQVSVYEYQPGNCTMYVVQITRLTGEQIDLAGGYHVLTLLNFGRRPTGSFVFSWPPGDPGYLSEKIGLGIGDCVPLLALIEWFMEQGKLR